MNKIKQYMASTAAIAGLLLFGSTALALVAQSNGNPQGPPEEIAQKLAALRESQGSDLQESDLASSLEVEGEVEVEVEGSDGTNHGHCVSYWTKQAKQAGLEGQAKGQFVSSIARDKSAVSAKVEEGGSPDETCEFGPQLTAAVDAQEESVNGKPAKSEESHGKSGEGHGKSGEGRGKSGKSKGKGPKN